jgi:hypothetical protein
VLWYGLAQVAGWVQPQTPASTTPTARLLAQLYFFNLGLFKEINRVSSEIMKKQFFVEHRNNRKKAGYQTFIEALDKKTSGHTLPPPRSASKPRARPIVATGRRRTGQV